MKMNEFADIANISTDLVHNILQKHLNIKSCQYDGATLSVNNKS